MWKLLAGPLQSTYHRRVVVVIGALLLSLWTLVAAWSYWERKSILASNALVLEQIAGSVHAQTNGLFRQAESALLVAGHWLESNPQVDPATSPDFISLVERLRKVSHGLLDIRLVTDRGAVVTVPQGGAGTGIYINDREYFQVQMDPARRGFYIARPVQSRSNGKWRLPVSVPLQRAGGHIAVAFIALELEKIAADFDTGRFSAAGAIGIARRDGTVLYRSPYEPAIIGQSLAKGAAWQQYLKTPSAGGTYESPESLFDGRSRIVAFSTLDDYSLVVYASNSKYDLMRPWLVNTGLRCLAVAMISAFACAMGWALLRTLTTAQVAEAIIRSTDDAVVGKDLNGIITSWNPGAQRMFGYAASEIVGQSILRLIPPDRHSEEHSILARIRCGESIDSFETVRVCKNGSNLFVSVTISPIRDRRGNLVGASKIARDNTLLKRQQEKLAHGAHYDALTGLPNRLLLSDRLNQAMAMSLRTGESLAVLYLDLDGFKAINDSYGHNAGDAVLVAVSDRMRHALRDVDTLARMGGDEFVAVLAGVAGAQDCIQLVQRVLAACAMPVVVDARELCVTASAGVTMYPQDMAEAEQLMRHADQAMYEAKQSGKNRLHMFDAVQEAEVKSRSQQQERIAQGLSANEFVLYYQPKVDMRSGAVVGAEALVRWSHPQRGIVSPGEFLPIIERHPLNEAMGTWVLEAALQQMTAWAAQGLVLPVSVNVAARQLQQDNFPAQLAQLLQRYPQVAPGWLELEVLETSALEDLTSTAGVLALCHALGVRFSIDDFGTGYSSLTYLRHLSVDTIKIDQSFVRDMLEDPGDLSIVNGVIGLAMAFHREVIAEGVETVEQGVRLIEMGCHMAQGYAIARPMPAAQLRGWCESWVPPPEWAAARSSRS